MRPLPKLALGQAGITNSLVQREQRLGYGKVLVKKAQRANLEPSAWRNATAGFSAAPAAATASASRQAGAAGPLHHPLQHWTAASRVAGSKAM